MTARGSGGKAIPLKVLIGEGTHGHAVRRVEVHDGSVELRKSATEATRRTYDILYREKYIDRQIVVDYEAGTSLANVHGRSADLAFALALAIEVSSGKRVAESAGGSFAATGVLGDDGSIQPVEGLAEKVAAALAILPPDSLIFFPGANEGELSTETRQLAAGLKIGLHGCFRLEQALAHVGFAIAHTWLDCPFRGLEPFEFKHASIFFGRETETDEILSLLRRRAEKAAPSALVLGPSGSGKSSLVLAGVIPTLLRRSRPKGVSTLWGCLRPRNTTADIDPERELNMLGEALCSSWRHGEEGGLSRPNSTNPLDPNAFFEWMHQQTVDLKRTRFVWALDQMEEWLQGPFQPTTVRQLGRFFSELAKRGVWLIGTMTSAALPLLREFPDLAAVFGIEGQYVLAARHSAASLQAVISEPARAAGLRFEPGLDSELFATANHGGPDVLPLLELLLTELYERRDPARNELRLEDYRTVGGLEGVVSARAEAVYAQASAAEKSAFPQFLWKLTTAGEILPSEYPPAHPMHGLLAAFLGRRLLVEDRDVRGDTGLRAAHEALFRHWPRAIEQRKRDENDIRLWLDLHREAGQWMRGERALIPPGPQLKAALVLVCDRLALWTAGDQTVIDYVDRSGQQHGRRRMLARGAVGVPAVVVGALGLYGAYDYVESLYVTQIRFEDVSIPESNYVAADSYLHHKGISIAARSPESSTMVIRNSQGLYNGRAVDLAANANVLTQQVGGSTAPVSYTLEFDQPVKGVRLYRAALWAATSSGVTHPAWNAHAFDPGGQDIASVEEPLLSSFGDVPAKSFVLKSTNGALVRSVKITSDFRDQLGRPFAGFQALLINEIDLMR